MKRAATRLVLILMICLILSHPYIETIDFWDNFLQTGQDAELELLGFFCLLGLAIVLMVHLCALICDLLADLHIRLRAAVQPVLISEHYTGVEVVCPPSLVPLRI